jgi:hypothetical protein
MMPQAPVEHFVTLFDSKFLPMGMALHDSLTAHGGRFHLWIICMDDLVAEQLGRLALPNVTLLPLESVETPELLAVKPDRSRGEYCWTITPFTFQAVLDRDPSVERVTYLDSDLYFFNAPATLLRGLDAAGKDVLITDHDFAPEYEYHRETSGRFCVQFVTFRRSAAAARVLAWWQEQCLAWCHARSEDGKFGDQMYLNDWPERFADAVYVVPLGGSALAPWNVHHYEQQGGIDPVFYHFQGFRIIARNEVRLFGGYLVGLEGTRLYDAYRAALRRNLDIMKRLGIKMPVLPEEMTLQERLAKMFRRDPHFARISP